MAEILKLDSKEIMQLPTRYRARLINNISGFKSANLIGTRSGEGSENLAIFNSVVHIGASPPYLGFILRPTTVERHTYENLKSTGFYTINQVHAGIHREAHMTSGKFGRRVSEFEACNLTPEYRGEFQAPFVAESKIRIGLSYAEEHILSCNKTILVVGKVELLEVPGSAVAEDGHIALESLETVAISGLEGYFTATGLGRYDYYKPGEELRSI